MARWDSWEPPMFEKPVAQLEWTTPYAALVHEGAEKEGTIYPARPWTDYATVQTDFESSFAAGFKATGTFQGALQAMVEAFEWACKEAMSIRSWYWPRATYRYNGDVVPPGPRDIRDLDTLYNSLNIDYQEGFTNG